MSPTPIARTVTIKLGHDDYAVGLYPDGRIESIQVGSGVLVLPPEALETICARISIVRRSGLFVGCIAGIVCTGCSVEALCADYVEKVKG